MVGEPALTHIPFNDLAFEQLVPANRKRLIKAVVQYSSSSGSGMSKSGLYSDIIKARVRAQCFYYGPLAWAKP